MNLRKIRCFIRGLKLGKSQLVPIRKRGMTGSGVELDCHTNVSKLVHTYGGYDVRGYYVVYKENLKTFGFFPHSVWETPEGKLVDVTLHHWKEDYVTFFPLHKCIPTKGYHYSQVQFYVSENGTVPIRISVDDDINVKVSRRECKRGQLKLTDFWGFTNKSYFETHPEKLDPDYISFSKPSTATGKTFNEIWDERMVA